MPDEPVPKIPELVLMIVGKVSISPLEEALMIELDSKSLDEGTGVIVGYGARVLLVESVAIIVGNVSRSVSDVDLMVEAVPLLPSVVVVGLV